MNVRRMTRDDLNQAVAIEAQCFSDPWTAGMFLSELEDPACRWFVLEEAGLVRAYAGMQTVLDEGNLNNIAVDPAFRRRGAAGLLLDRLFAESRALSLRFLTLEVRAGNQPAIRLYTERGFVQVGRRRGYYLQPPEDALLMTFYFTKE